jgi:purine-nucleoside phosphorylase
MNIQEPTLKRCLTSIRTKTNFVPVLGLVLGSGLGDFASEITPVCEISYRDIDGFPVSTVQGHDGKLIFGYLKGVPLVAMKGRVHFFEGYPIQTVVLPVRLMRLLGAKVLFLTNACGGINPSYKPGDFMIIEDHLSCFVPNPLVGPNLDELGPRFPDMSHVYDPNLCASLKATADRLHISVKYGIYVQYSGPSYETPAEIRMFAHMGADAVGMSTAVEAIAAVHCGLRVVGLSFISNLAAGISKTPLSHEEVQEAASAASKTFRELVVQAILDFKLTD